MTARLSGRGMYKKAGEVLGSEKGMKPEGKLNRGYPNKNESSSL
jgi:hypothetical protein